VRATTEALRSAHRVRDLFITDEVASANTDLVQLAVGRGVRLTVVGERVARALSDTVHPQGVTAVVDLPTAQLEDVLRADVRLVVVLDGVADPGNAGTVVRTAAAAGADAVIFCRDSVDPYGAKCVRATAGALLHIPVVTEAEPADAIARLRERGVQVLATSVDGTDVFDLSDELRRPTVWLFGGEAHGLSPDVQVTADRTVRVPMTSRVESLNLAAAAAICLYASAQALDTR
jgi:RNA methyltransferase, TrmH family